MYRHRLRERCRRKEIGKGFSIMHNATTFGWKAYRAMWKKRTREERFVMQLPSRRRHRRSLPAQAEASMSASFNHFTVSLLAKILHINTRYDFFSLQLCFSWLCQNLFSLALNVLVVLADTQLGKLFHVFPTLLEQELIRRWDSERKLLCSTPGRYANSLK